MSSEKRARVKDMWPRRLCAEAGWVGTGAIARRLTLRDETLRSRQMEAMRAFEQQSFLCFSTYGLIGPDQRRHFGQKAEAMNCRKNVKVDASIPKGTRCPNHGQRGTEQHKMSISPALGKAYPYMKTLVGEKIHS
eukprot:6207355-Pleurochrysis_carterae.AAC.2